MGIEVKKGNASWKPAQALELTKRDPDYRYRWANKDDLNIEKKLSEGWVFADKGETLHMRPKTVEAGSGLASGNRTEYRDLILMKLPEERALARAAYYSELTAEQVKGLKQSVNNKLRGAAANSTGAHGDISIG